MVTDGNASGPHTSSVGENESGRIQFGQPCGSDHRLRIVNFASLKTAMDVDQLEGNDEIRGRGIDWGNGPELATAWAFCIGYADDQRQQLSGAAFLGNQNARAEFYRSDTSAALTRFRSESVRATEGIRGRVERSDASIVAVWLHRPYKGCIGHACSPGNR